MKLLFLKILLQRRARDEGFTLPMVIAIGLVMILLGAFNILSASEENLTAISQNMRSDALAIAEVGVARYRELLDSNRVLAINNRDQWTAQAAVCDDDIRDTGTGWANHDNDGGAAGFNAAMWQAVTLDENIIARDLNNDGDATDATVNIGWYKIVDYEYDIDGNIGDGDSDGILDDTDDNGVFDVTDDANNDTNGDGNSDARGILTVKGRTPDGSEAQINVDIPIRINQQDMNNLAPALWIEDNTITTGDLGTLTIGNGNIVIRDRAVTTVGSEADGCRDFAALTGAGHPVISDSRDLPDINTIVTTINNAATATVGDQTNDVIPGDGVFGRPGHDPYNPNSDPTTFDPTVDCANIRNCRYYYDPASINVSNTDFTTDGIAKVTLYVNGPVNINATTSNVNIGSSISSSYFEIYVDNTNPITITANAGQTITINGFIHAPESTLTITGGGTVNINGSVWVKDWVNNSGNTVNITPDDTDISSTLTDKSYEFYTTTVDRTPKPLTTSPTNWKTEEVE